MKILKCPHCASLIDSKNINKGSWGSNPFVRATTTCTNCGSKIKPKIWLIILFLLWIVVGFYFMFSEYESLYINGGIIGGLVVMISLMRFGLSHETE